MNAGAASLALFCAVLAALAVDACVHRPDLQAQAAVDAGVSLGGAAQAGAQSAAGSQAEGVARVQVKHGASHLRLSLPPGFSLPADAGALLEIEQDADEIDADAVGRADAGAAAVADAGAQLDAGVQVAAGAGAGVALPGGLRLPWWLVGVLAAVALLALGGGKLLFTAAKRRFFGG